MSLQQTKTELPEPDQYGNYWLLDRGDKNRLSGPAIFPSKRLRGGKVVRNGHFLASTGRNILWDHEDMRFKRFATAQAALESLEKLDLMPA